MDLIQITTQIEKKIKQLDQSIAELSVRASAKAEAISNYDHTLALTLIKLKNGVSFDMDREIIQNPSVSSSEKIAKGLIYKEKLEVEKCEAFYKNLTTGIACVQAQLNALQSMLRYLQ